MIDEAEFSVIEALPRAQICHLVRDRFICGRRKLL